MSNPLASSTPVRRFVDHCTVYQYGQAVESSVHQAVLEPLTLLVSPQDAFGVDQRLVDFELSVHPRPSVLRRRKDAFGNTVHTFELNASEPELSICARGELVLLAREQPLAQALANTPAWETIAMRFEYSKSGAFLPCTQFLYESPHIQTSDALRAFAAQAFTPEKPIASAAWALMNLLYEGFEYRSGSTDIRTSIETVLEQKQGVCQDFAHLMIGALRSIGLPARYVSGYMLTEAPEGQEKLVGADASHAWLAVWLGEQGWLELDPTNNQMPDHRYVRLATGRDYADVPPVKGVLHGSGNHHMSVAVTVR